MKKIKTMFAVEHYNKIDNSSTFEIFATLEKAKSFCEDKTKWNTDYFPLAIFKADFNKENLYLEDESWNYDDYSDTILKYHNFRIELRSKNA